MFAYRRRSIWLCMFGAAALIAQHEFLESTAASQKDIRSGPETQLIHSVAGPDLYRAYCASCHGIDAHGNGPAAPALRAKVPDLTLIAKRNRDVFPADRVRKIIAGEEGLVSHGSREMPIWGPVFRQVEVDQDWGYVRLQNLTRYLESIQKR